MNQGAYIENKTEELCGTSGRRNSMQTSKMEKGKKKTKKRLNVNETVA